LESIYGQAVAGERESMVDTLKQTSGEPAIRLVMLPKYTNPDGDIFGGIILSLIDEAAAVEAQRQGHHRYVTVAMDSIQFHRPVAVGDIVSLWCRTVKIGRTSLQIHIEVMANPRRSDDHYKVTEATVTMVAIDENRNPVPIRNAMEK
jgi:acyl-CoA thioesterase YciA